MTTIKSILEELTVACSRNSVISVTDKFVQPDEAIKKNIELVDQALQQIEQLIEEVVGKIEQPYTSENPWEEDSRHARDRLRTEQRANLKKVIR